MRTLKQQQAAALRYANRAYDARRAGLDAPVQPRWMRVAEEIAREASEATAEHDNPVIQAPATVTKGRDAVQTEPVWTANEVRALTLAAKFGMTAGWVRHYTGAADGSWQLLRVQSHTDCTKRYDVLYHPHTDTFGGCSCPAYGQCSHLGAARLRIERDKLARAMAERQAECERQYRYFDSLERSRSA